MEENQTPTSPIAGEPALMALRATLQAALTDWDNIGATYHNRGELMDAMGDFTAAVEAAREQLDAMLGIVEDEALLDPRNAMMTDEDMGEWIDSETGKSLGPVWVTAKDAEGEMRAEAKAERQADARLELAAELASCDWDGWD